MAKPTAPPARAAEAEAEAPVERMGERLNDEPVIFRGYTDSEFMLAMALAGGACLPVGAAAGFLAGKTSMGVGAAMAAAVGLVVLGASAHQAWKRGRPLRWLQQRAARRLAEAGLARPQMLLRRGAMSLGRDDITRRLRKGGKGRRP